MDCTNLHSTRWHRSVFAQRGWRGTALTALALGLASVCHAESALQTSSSSGRSLNASAHLDFRITVLPVLALSAQTSGLRIQGNGGVLTVQRDPVGRWDGRSPDSSIQMRPQGQVVDAAMHASTFGQGELITIASP